MKGKKGEGSLIQIRYEGNKVNQICGDLFV